MELIPICHLLEEQWKSAGDAPPCGAKPAPPISEWLTGMAVGSTDAGFHRVGAPWASQPWTLTTAPSCRCLLSLRSIVKPPRHSAPCPVSHKQHVAERGRGRLAPEFCALNQSRVVPQADRGSATSHPTWACRHIQGGRLGVPAELARGVRMSKWCHQHASGAQRPAAGSSPELSLALGLRAS